LSIAEVITDIDDGPCRCYRAGEEKGKKRGHRYPKHPSHQGYPIDYRDQQKGVFWAAHQSDLPYSQIERLVNLGSLPPFGFKVACFPLKIQGGSAGPARVVAILQD
jgi:kynurenine formamidase